MVPIPQSELKKIKKNKNLMGYYWHQYLLK